MFVRDDRLSWDVNDDYHTYAEITVASICPYTCSGTGGRATYVRACGDKGRLGLITSSRTAFDDRICNLRFWIDRDWTREKNFHPSIVEKYSL